MKAVVLAGTSEIGSVLINQLIEQKYSRIIATYNSRQPTNKSPLIKWIKLDIKDYEDPSLINAISAEDYGWDLFVSCIGTQHPVGRFDSIDSAEWMQGVNINSTLQIATLVNLMPFRCKTLRPCAVFFAGGGTNSATPYYSAQTLGKISLIKSMELLSSEYIDTTFFTLGPGWVKADIHAATLNAGPSLAGENFYKTEAMFANQSLMNTAEKAVFDLLKLVSTEHVYTNGRNFSSVHDDISKTNLEKLYEYNPEFYKLRRSCNEFQV
ncbi:MAG: hypothetical protein CL831_08945 [Crocinitomicaceae bacterium]|nr:hypothetical protein [Crocinitomicaceae bacterium]|tara:strand:+ start:3895 stop:4695 length:801 start_codon:yes stop_codon:yes gene_type:complete